MAITPAVVADPARLAEVLGGRTVHPDAYLLHPQGARIHVVLDELPEKYGELFIPEVVQGNERPGAGTIMAAGTGAWRGVEHYPGVPEFGVDNGTSLFGPSEDLLYKHIIFGQYVGKPLRLDYTRDDNWKSAVLVMTTRDIWAIDTGPPPYGNFTELEA